MDPREGREGDCADHLSGEDVRIPQGGREEFEEVGAVRRESGPEGRPREDEGILPKAVEEEMGRDSGAEREEEPDLGQGAEGKEGADEEGGVGPQAGLETQRETERLVNEIGQDRAEEDEAEVEPVAGLRGGKPCEPEGNAQMAEDKHAPLRNDRSMITLAGWFSDRGASSPPPGERLTSRRDTAPQGSMRDPILRLAMRTTRRTRATAWGIAFACMVLVGGLSLADGLSTGVRGVASRFESGPAAYIQGDDLLMSRVDPGSLTGASFDFHALRVHPGRLEVNGLDLEVFVASLEIHANGNVTSYFPPGPRDLAPDVGLRGFIEEESALISSKGLNF